MLKEETLTECVLTEPELTALCAEWQKRLRLQDWTVKVKIARERDMDANRAGQILWVSLKKVALIKILDSVDYNHTDGWPQDHEETLVHELLHLHNSRFPTEENNIDEEVAITCVAQALVALKRKNVNHI